jgi:7-cyano-7-deazaguanine synthase in queuosine biosynthesis
MEYGNWPWDDYVCMILFNYNQHRAQAMKFFAFLPIALAVAAFVLRFWLGRGASKLVELQADLVEVPRAHNGSLRAVKLPARSRKQHGNLAPA